MRCKNCGWLNEPNVIRCVKCNAPLMGSMIDKNEHSQFAQQQLTPLKATVREIDADYVNSKQEDISAESPQQLGQNICPKCGYPLRSGANECPRCNIKISVSNKDLGTKKSMKEIPFCNADLDKGVKGTINPWAAPSEEQVCTLRRIPWENEHINYEPVSFSGNEIVLNRANTDENNNSITSKIQAIITHENGEWFIENKSSMQTTFLRLNRKLKLHDGDVIVLGNRMLEFKKG